MTAPTGPDPSADPRERSWPTCKQFSIYKVILHHRTDSQMGGRVLKSLLLYPPPCSVLFAIPGVVFFCCCCCWFIFLASFQSPFPMGGGLRLGELECVEYYWKAPMPGGAPCAMAWYRLMLLFYQLLLCSSLSSNIEQKKRPQPA